MEKQTIIHTKLKRYYQDALKIMLQASYPSATYEIGEPTLLGDELTIVIPEEWSKNLERFISKLQGNGIIGSYFHTDKANDDLVQAIISDLQIEEMCTDLVVSKDGSASLLVHNAMTNSVVKVTITPQ